MKEFKRLTPINSCKIINVAEVKSLIGSGTAQDPIVEITEYYSINGELLARHSPTINKLEIGEWLK